VTKHSEPENDCAIRRTRGQVIQLVTAIHTSNKLLLHPPESLLDAVVYLVKLASDIRLALRVGRLELHLRQLVHGVPCGVPDLGSAPIHRFSILT